MTISRITVTLALLLLLGHSASAQNNSAAPILLPENLRSGNIESLGGTPFRLTEGNQKLTVLFLFGSWCSAPCRFAASDLNVLLRDYGKRGIEVIGLTSENPQTEVNLVRKFVRSNKVRFKIGWIDRQTELTLTGGRPILPQILIVTPDGNVLMRFIGYNSINKRSFKELKAIVERNI